MDLINIHKIAIIIDKVNDRVDRVMGNLILSLFCAYALYTDRMTGLTGLFSLIESRLTDYYILRLVSSRVVRLHPQNNPVNPVNPVNVDFVPKIALFLTGLDFLQPCQTQFNPVTQAWLK